MKIRTDFVTNSSSISTAEIVIDNPLLLEILQRFKEMGVFGEAEPFFGIGEYFSNDDHFNGSEFESKVKTPAFYCYEELGGDGWQRVDSGPKSISEILSEMLKVIDDAVYKGYKNYNQELYANMKDELTQKEAEIAKNYAMVHWTNSDEYEIISGNQIIRWKYSYDPDNGEKYIQQKAREVYKTNKREKG